MGGLLHSAAPGGRRGFRLGEPRAHVRRDPFPVLLDPGIMQGETRGFKIAARPHARGTIGPPKHDNMGRGHDVPRPHHGPVQSSVPSGYSSRS